MREIVIDTNAAVDFMRGDATALQRYRTGWTIVLPIHVVGELFYGAFSSRNSELNAKIIHDLANTWHVLAPTAETASLRPAARA